MSSMSEQNPTNPQDPLHYAPRYLREKPEGARLSLVEDARDAPQSAEQRPSRAIMPAAKHLDARLEGAVFESLRRMLPSPVHAAAPCRRDLPECPAKRPGGASSPRRPRLCLRTLPRGSLD